jgi:hypothetical protein
MNSTDFIDVIEFPNSATGGIFWFFVIIAVFVVMVTVLRRFGASNAVLSACLVCFVASSMFFYIGLLNILVPLCFGISIPLVAFYKHYTGE